MAEMKLQEVFSPKFFNINYVFTIKDLDVLWGFWLFFPLLLFDNKKCLAERNTVHLPKNYLEDSRNKTIAIIGLSWTRETLLSLGGKTHSKIGK